MRAVFQTTIVDLEGTVVPNATITVRRASDNSLIQLYTDFEGGAGLGNPFAADGNGFCRFYTDSAIVHVEAVSGAFHREYRHVLLGLGTLESDVANFISQKESEIAALIVANTEVANTVLADVQAQLLASGVELADGIAAPAAVAGRATLYVDSADGDLKVKFSDGTVRLITQD